ncbi:unnamed protein product [Polarella glacialis]|uniref:Transmembrane protein n=1 Tax=Polarella glacialis TaxID=89957 RepID=A0A813LFM1_POLGL|nr:unnamed protein product [Polarella glacialis]
MASFSSLLGSEAFLPAASFFFGIAGAMAQNLGVAAGTLGAAHFCTGRFSHVDVSATSGSDSVPRGGDGAASREEKLGEGSAEGHQLAEGDKDGQLRQRQPQPLGKGLTLEQESRIRDGVRRLPPESRKALQDWLNMEDGNKMALLAMNCLVLILVLGMLLIGAASLAKDQEEVNTRQKFWRRLLMPTILLNSEARRLQILQPSRASVLQHKTLANKYVKKRFRLPRCLTAFCY